MKIQDIFSHLFVKRGFLGLLALCWGFMLGGSLLMTAVTYGLALAGIDHFNVTLYQIVALVMILPVAGMLMESEYQEKIITSASGFARAFLVAIFFGAMMPILLIIGAVITGRERLQKKDSPERTTVYVDKTSIRGTKISSRSVRGKPTGFWQDMMSGFFLKLAH